jgi:hypothetical protein
MTRKRRTLSDLQRRRPFIHPRESVLIVCEGEKTEPQYFDAMRNELRLQKFVEVHVNGKRTGSDPISVVDHAIFLQSERARIASRSPILTVYDFVWCVMDVETQRPHPTLASALDKAKKHNLKVALSNPFFEYWFLLHFKKISTPFAKDKGLHDALKEVHPSYKKSRIGFNILYPRTETAIKHSEEVLEETACDEDLRDHNPSTHVHRVVRHLQKIAKRPITLRK